MKRLCITSVLVGCALLDAPPAGALQVNLGDDLRLFLGPGIGYSVPIYGRRPDPGADYIYFEGDPITLRVSVTNWSRRPVTLKTAAASLTQALRVELVRLDRATRTESTTLRFDRDAFVQAAGLRTPTAWGTDVVLQPRWSFGATATVDFAGPAGVGRYGIEVTGVSFGCEPACAVLPGATDFRFEIKPADTLSEKVDRHLLRALRLQAFGRYGEAAAEVREALSLYPTASGAYQVLGLNAGGQGRWNEAAEAYERATHLLESGQDELRRQESEPGDPLTAVRSSARDARARAVNGRR